MALASYMVCCYGVFFCLICNVLGIFLDANTGKNLPTYLYALKANISYVFEFSSILALLSLHMGLFANHSHFFLEAKHITKLFISAS